MWYTANRKWLQTEDIHTLQAYIIYCQALSLIGQFLEHSGMSQSGPTTSNVVAVTSLLDKKGDY